jgi:peroxiredoxin
MTNRSSDPAVIIGKLTGARLPPLKLPAPNLGREVPLVRDGPSVAYVYPMTGTPGRPLPPGWMSIPGAYGCTAESCAFRDHAAELERLEATVVGISAQHPEEQREFAAREGISYPLLNDAGFELEQRLGLPTFEVAGRRFYVRLTLVVVGGRIERVFHPVADVERHPEEVAAWLSERPGSWPARPGEGPGP